MDKKAVTYKQILNHLKDVAARKQFKFSPSLIMTDFETGVTAAIKTEVSITHISCVNSFFPLSFIYF